MQNPQMLRNLIRMFLALNPEPADMQVHSLAAALGMDKEALEAVMYEMLGESDQVLGARQRLQAASVEVLADADQDEVLEGDIPPEQMDQSDVATNDGDPTNEDTGVQEETHDDGTDMYDRNVGLTNVDVLSDDGVPSFN